MRSISTHIIALLLGVLLTFSGMKVLSSQAEPLPETVIPSSTSSQTSQTVAKVSTTTNADSFVSAAIARTGAAVVRIDTETTVTRRVDPMFDDPFFRQFFGDQFFSQIPTEKKVTGQGSGFIVDHNGIILTNAHVVSKADQVTVTLRDGRSFAGEVKGTDEVTDLAVVKIDATRQNLPVAPLGDSSQVEVGDWAIAVGNPVGLNNTVT